MVRVDLRRRTPRRLTRRRPVDVGDAPLVVHEWGDPSGDAVVYWHGLSPDETGLRAAPLADVLAGDFDLRVIAPDAPGFGESPPRDDFTPSGLSALLTGMLDELGVDACAFVGHSWGATIGCHFGATARARVSALALLDGGYVDLDDAAAGDLRRATLAECIEEGKRRGAVWPETWGTAFHAFLQADPVSETYGGLVGLPILLLVAGVEDPPVSKASGRGLARFRSRLPDAEVRVLDGVGHDVPGEAGAAVGRIVGEWLAA